MKAIISFYILDYYQQVHQFDFWDFLDSLRAEVKCLKIQSL